MTIRELTRMKPVCARVFFGLVFTIMAAAHAATAQELSKQAKIERILALTNSQATMDKMMDQVTTMIGSQMKSQTANLTPEQIARGQDLRKKMMDQIKSRMSFEKMRPDLIRIYAETYTDSEIDGMLAFFESPVGQSYLKKTPEVAQKIFAASQSQLGDIMQEVRQMMTETAERK